MGYGGPIFCFQAGSAGEEKKKKKMKGREQGEGKEKGMETSTQSGLSRQRWGHGARGAPDSARGGGYFESILNCPPQEDWDFRYIFRGGNLSSYTSTLYGGRGGWFGFGTPPVSQAGCTDGVSGIHGKLREADVAVGFKEMAI